MFVLLLWWWYFLLTKLEGGFSWLCHAWYIGALYMVLYGCCRVYWVSRSTDFVTVSGVRARECFLSRLSVFSMFAGGSDRVVRVCVFSGRLYVTGEIRAVGGVPHVGAEVGVWVFGRASVYLCIWTLQ